ncbi:FAD/NAD(P)-binding protein [Sinomonas sp. JGH33]|uniref:FAD/NAD(P)-binding protein n=1 Tax=Sinomonas terricola TaxID=3110330 RepID=A0ABU5T9F3_9MICC|nr:FAD/NAD(P)-binding protein [Sinomonas sp. JGH33]MEA5456316.1 FAD/NAD(P)-binding protein [Sinomonas sp. JGH33]
MKPAVLAVVGGGPRAAMLLERLSASLPEYAPAHLDIHLIEPHVPGSGRIWRRDQSPLLALNSRAADVTMFTDSSVQCEGPSADGPSLLEWSMDVSGPGTFLADDGELRLALDAAPELAAEARGLTAESFPTRRLQSLYLEWFFRCTVARLERQGVAVAVHRDTAVRVEPAPAGSRSALVRLATGRHVAADAVVLALGHADAEPLPSSSALADFARRHGATYVPPDYTTDADLSGIAPGADVIVSGLGLAFVDLAVLLFEGRGGRFAADPSAGPEEGALTYVPSGLEPRLFAGSRRGVPYRSKARGPLRGEEPEPLRFLTEQAVAPLLARRGEIDFVGDLWPLIARDIEYGYYRELFTGYPDRVLASWAEFSARFEAAARGERSRTELDALIGSAVPVAADRLDLDRLDRPLDGLSGSPDEVHRAVVRHVQDDLRLRDSGEHTETLGLFLGILRAYMELGRLVPLERLSPASREVVCGWWHGFFSFVDSGPPPRRLRELLALERAGFVRFLGPGLRVEGDDASGLFRATAAAGSLTASASVFVEARLPGPAVAGSANPLLRALAADGLAREDAAGRLRTGDDARVLGDAFAWLFAVGAGTTGWGAGAFARPRSNAAPFRDTDALARRLLAQLTPEPSARLESAVALVHGLAG